jgi:hypothetical protein
MPEFYLAKSGWNATTSFVIRYSLARLPCRVR